MIPKRILLVGKENLFTSGLENLLAKKFNQYTTRIEPTNTHALITEIWRIQPSIVIINTLDLKQPLAILAHLGAYPALKLIVVNEYDNNIVIYEHEGLPTLFTNSEKPEMQALLLN